VTAAELLPGDILLYRPNGIFGRLIALKTWHPISHVEVYLGGGVSAASRDGQGTGIYPLRLAQLALVCRPIVPCDVGAGLRWFATQPHQPYGWLDLAAFFGATVDGRGVVCSPFATEFVRACGLDPFNGEPSIRIAPFQFALSPVFRVTEVSTHEVAADQARTVVRDAPGSDSGRR
jgi:hypothetical protein